MDFKELMLLITTKNALLIDVPMLIFSEAKMRAHIGDLDRESRFEDLALSYFESFGYYGNRTRKNLYGYLGDFRDIVDNLPPWIEARGPDEYYNHVTGNTHDTWEPLIEWFFNYTFEELNRMRLIAHQAYKSRREESDIKIPSSIQKLLNSREEFNFKRLYALAHAFGKEKLLEVVDLLSDYDGDLYENPVGAPDILVWSLKPKIWFFAEVKGHNDSLSNFQINWIREFKDKIGDNIFILQIV